MPTLSSKGTHMVKLGLKSQTKGTPCVNTTNVGEGAKLHLQHHYSIECHEKGLVPQTKRKQSVGIQVVKPQ